MIFKLTITMGTPDMQWGTDVGEALVAFGKELVGSDNRGEGIMSGVLRDRKGLVVGDFQFELDKPRRVRRS
jgi:hypothetical protein